MVQLLHAPDDLSEIAGTHLKGRPDSIKLSSDSHTKGHLLVKCWVWGQDGIHETLSQKKKKSWDLQLCLYECHFLKCILFWHAGDWTEALCMHVCYHWAVSPALLLRDGFTNLPRTQSVAEAGSERMIDPLFVSLLRCWDHRPVSQAWLEAHPWSVFPF